jgi:hypothetical protein
MTEPLKGGYYARFVRYTEGQGSEGWTCNHGCTHGIQLVSHATQDVVIEWCALEAESIAGLILEEVDQSTRMMFGEAQLPRDTKHVS